MYELRSRGIDGVAKSSISFSSCSQYNLPFRVPLISTVAPHFPTRFEAAHPYPPIPKRLCSRSLSLRLCKIPLKLFHHREGHGTHRNKRAQWP